ncbi:MAG TPA: hypothetical protein VH417_20540 [Vicinamibacterales bacterium]
MKRLVFVAIASLAVACGNRSTDARTSGSAAQSGPQAQAGARSNEPAPEASSPTATATTSTTQQDQRVTVTGCLRGGESAAGPAGTAGRTAAQPTGAAGAVSGAAGRFTLTNAKPADAAPGGGQAAPRSGIGANGAGGSGGPLVSGVSSYLLSGSTPELQARVNQQVRVTGTIDARETIADAPRPDAGRGAPAPAAERHLAVESIQTVTASCP